MQLRQVTTTLDLSALSISAATLSINNQRPSTLDLTLQTAYNTDLATAYAIDLSYDQHVELLDGSTVIFSGFCDEPTRDPTSNTISLTIKDHWWILERQVAIQLGGYDNCPSCTSSDLTFSGDLSASITRLLTYDKYTTLATLIQLGTIDLPTIDLSETTYSNQTVAQTLTSLLKNVPGTICAWTYTPTAPAALLSIYQQTSTSLQTASYQTGTDNIAALNYQQLKENIVSGVLIRYQQPMAVEESGETTEVLNLISTDQYPSTCDPYDKNTIWRTITLSGSSATRKTITVTSSHANDAATMIAYCSTQKFPIKPILGATSWQPYDFYAHGSFYSGFLNHILPTSTGSRFWNCVVGGDWDVQNSYTTAFAIPTNLGVATNIVKDSETSVTLLQTLHTGLPQGNLHILDYSSAQLLATALQGATLSGNFWLGKVRVHTHSCLVSDEWFYDDHFRQWSPPGSNSLSEAFSNWTGRSTDTYAVSTTGNTNITLDYNSTTPPAVGAAQQYYEQCSAPQYKGSIKIADPTTQTPLTRNIAINTSITGQIQQNRYDLQNALRTITFGPPEQLAIQDFATRLQT